MSTGEWPFDDELSIDSNIFMHLCSRDENFNGDGHISLLLLKLVLRRARLCVDGKDVIRGEYERVVEPMIRNESQTGIEADLLRYWMAPENHESVDVSGQKDLLRIIKTIIIENERVDRLLVCVAFYRGRALVTNDVMHIVVGPTREGKRGERRARLLRETKKHCASGAEILLSSEAHQRMGGF